MSLTRSLFRNSFFLLALIPVFAVWGFWVTYFTRPPETLALHDHVHGYAMFGWTLLLVAQSFLVRTDRRSLHRQLGKLGWVLGPLIIVSTVVLANYRLNVRGLTPEGLYVLGLQIWILASFTVFWVQAMRHRSRPDVHARWMICTAFTLLDPIFARIIMVNFVQVPLESGIIQYITYAFIDLIVIILVIADWKSQQRRDVFLPALAALLFIQLASLLSLKVPAWSTFAAWFIKLPLS